MKPRTLYWIGLSDYDMDTADAMLKSRRYVYVVFMCHLSVEKMLKACMTELTDVEPPRIHILPRLAELADILKDMTTEQKVLLNKLTDEQIPTRYPSELMNLTKIYTLSFAKSILKDSKEMRVWLRQRLASDAP